jgi:hypothetical protein
MKPLDYTPLTSKVTYRERMRQKGSWGVKSSVVMTGLAVLWAVTYGITSQDLIGVALFSLPAGMVALVAFAVYTYLGKKVRIQRFTQQNDLLYRSHGREGSEGRYGRLFERGHSRHFSDIIVSRDRSFDEIGTFNYVVGSGKNSRSYSRGYVRIRLPRRLPHMILDAKSNNFLGKISNIDGLGGQKLSLEGDFDKYFTLYAPQEYATDALYVFTPDIMQLLIDSAHKYDCEIIDDNFFIHSNTGFDVTKPSTYQEVLKITDALAHKLDRRTDYYADERVGDRDLNIVAQKGVRLNRRTSIATIVTAVAVVVYMVYIFARSIINP